MNSSGYPRLAVRALLALVAVVLLTRCSEPLRGSANASGSDRSSSGQIRLGLPF